MSSESERSVFLSILASITRLTGRGGKSCNVFTVTAAEFIAVTTSGLRLPSASSYKLGMTWSDEEAPTLDQFEALARDCLAKLPAEFRRLAGDIVMRIEEFPDKAVCAEMGIEDPFQLTGLYQGVDLGHKSSAAIAEGPDMIFLYRRPILDEWADGRVTLRELITHILVHEIGHHFGLSDEAMHEIEESERE